MDDSKQDVALLDRQLASLRASILERPMPGLAEARDRSARARRRRPIQIAVFVIGLTVLIAIPVLYGVRSSTTPQQPEGRGSKPQSIVSERLDQIAQQWGAKYGDPDITSDRWVSFNEPNKIRTNVGVIEPGPVYWIEITGSFSLQPSPVPYATNSAPCTTPLRSADIFVNEQTFVVEDFAAHVAPSGYSKLPGTAHIDHFDAPPGANSSTVQAAECRLRTAITEQQKAAARGRSAELQAQRAEEAQSFLSQER
jgi:hypothetical protein